MRGEMMWPSTSFLLGRSYCDVTSMIMFQKIIILLGSRYNAIETQLSLGGTCIGLCKQIYLMYTNGY